MYICFISYQGDGDNKCPAVNEEIVSAHFDDVNQSGHYYQTDGLKYEEGFNLILDEEPGRLQPN